MIPREIAGPQAQFERGGPHAPFRDVRPFTVRLRHWLRGQASGPVLAGMAGLAYTAPATVDLAVVAGTLYAAWVLTRRLEAPIRLPRSARRRDWSDPDPSTRRARMAAGEEFLGWDQQTGQEIWLTNEDVRQHASIPGTTGAGKTTTILSNLVNPLCQGSGFALVDAKANNELSGQAYALARHFGRDDDVLVLNLLTASLAAEATAHGYNALKQTNTFNPFATGNADALRELLASQLGEASPTDNNGVFRARAIALIGTLAPVLVWMRDHKGVPIDISKIRFAIELRGIWTLATHRVFLARDPATGAVSEVPVPDIPEDLVYPLQAYLGEIPGYDTSLPYNQQKTEKPSEQHGYAIFYFTATFTQLAVSLGHIFKAESGDIGMRDVVLNRRVLIVNLPALENSDDTLAALGRIVVASLRGMMAQLLGAKLEGDPREIFAHKPGMGIGSFKVMWDELGSYATSGMDRMLAMGRGLNMAFGIAFQELGGIWARLGEKTYSLLGNANLTVGMRQQDAGRTREWLEKTAGQAWVTQATSYQGGADGVYREASHAEMRQVSRVDWQDYLRLLPGEAIVLFGGRRVYARLFRAEVRVDGPVRLNRPLMLAAPWADEVRAERAGIDAVRERIEAGLLSGEPDRPLSGVLAAAVDALAGAAARGATAQGCIAAALDAAGQEADRLARARAAYPSRSPQDGGEDEAAGTEAETKDTVGGDAEADAPERQPITEFTPMLDLSTTTAPAETGRAGRPREPVDGGLLSNLTAIEVAAGTPRASARASALAALGERDAALAGIVLPAPPPMLESELRERLDHLDAQLATLGLVGLSEDGLPEAGWQDAAE